MMRLRYILGILVIISLMVACSPSEAPEVPDTTEPETQPQVPETQPEPETQPQVPDTTEPESDMQDSEPETTEPESEIEDSEPEPMQGGDFILDGKSGFDPEETTIAKGSELIFRVASDDKTQHSLNVRGPNNMFDKSGSLVAGDTYTYTFDKEGEYKVLDVPFGKWLMVTVQ